MTISELIELLQKYPQDAEILTRTPINTLVSPTRFELVEIVPVIQGSKHDKHPSFLRSIPGRIPKEWRIPDSGDESKTEREYGFVL